MTSFIRMPTLRAALKAAAKLQEIKATRRRLWQAQIEKYRSRLFAWPWSKPLSDGEIRARIDRRGLNHPDVACWAAEKRCREVLTLFQAGTASIYLDAETLRAIT